MRAEKFFVSDLDQLQSFKVLPDAKAPPSTFGLDPQTLKVLKENGEARKEWKQMSIIFFYSLKPLKFAAELKSK